MGEKVYRNQHHFSPYTLVHHYKVDGSMTREWRTETKKENLFHYDESGQLVPVITNPPELKRPIVKTDGSELLADLIDDIYCCFCFTGATFSDYNGHDEELHRAIYESKLPAGTRVYQYDIGRISQGVVEMLETSTEIEVQPKNYYELFEIIGIPCEYDEEQHVDKYTIWQYPDSVILTLKAEGDKLFFGYGR